MTILLNPGPVVLSERVRNALLKPDLCHRESEFTELQSSIRNKLLKVYNLPEDDWTAILLTGSGTSAMEAMISSMVPDYGKLLVIENGVYGERLTKIARIHQIETVTHSLEWGEKIDLISVAETINKNPGLTHLAMVHHETTTGRLNELADIGQLCLEMGIEFLLDGVSSFGAEMIDFMDWEISACAATANKCLHGVPGTSFVIVRRESMPDKPPQRSLYLDLASYLKQQDQGGTPFTQSVQTFYALDEALSELEESGGSQARYQQYRQLALQVRAGLDALGIKALLAESESSVVLNTYCLPSGMSYETLHDHLKTAGFIIYAGQADLAKTFFRISTMGEINANDIDRLLTAIKELLIKSG